MNKSFISIFFVLVSACGLLDAAQGQHGRQPDQAEREYNFLAMVGRQLELSRELLEVQNQSLQDQPAQPRGPVQQSVVSQDELRRQPRAPQVLPAEVDTRSETQKLLHSGLRIEEIKHIIRDNQNGNDALGFQRIDLSDLSTVVVLPGARDKVFLVDTIRNLPVEVWQEGQQHVQGRRAPFTGHCIDDWFLELLGLPQVNDQSAPIAQQPQDAPPVDAQRAPAVAQQPVVQPPAEVDTRSDRQKLLHGKLPIEEIKRIVRQDQDGNDPITQDEIDLNDLLQVVVLPSSLNRVFLADTIRNLQPYRPWAENYRRDPFTRDRIPDWCMKLINNENVPEWFVQQLMQDNANLQQELSEAHPPAGNRANRQQHVWRPAPVAPAPAPVAVDNPQAQPGPVNQDNGPQNMQYNWNNGSLEPAHGGPFPRVPVRHRDGHVIFSFTNLNDLNLSLEYLRRAAPEQFYRFALNRAEGAVQQELEYQYRLRERPPVGNGRFIEMLQNASRVITWFAGRPYLRNRH